MNTQSARQRAGFTLLELLVVVAILAILAGLIIPQFGGTTERSQMGAAASNLADINRSIQQYKAMNGSYPDGWDTLTGATGTTSSVTPTSALYSKLSTTLLSTLTIATPTVDQATRLNTAGINHITYHDTAYTGRPSDSGWLATHIYSHSSASLSTDLALAKLDTTNINVTNLLTSSNGVAGFNLQTDPTTHTYFAFGVGPKSWMVSENLSSAPLLDVHDVGKFYSRAIAIFEVPNSSTSTEKARFVGMLGPDGQSGDMYLSQYYQQATRDH